MSDQIDLWQVPDLQLSKDQQTRADGFREWLRSTKIPVALFLSDAKLNDTFEKSLDKQMGWLQRTVIEESSSLSAAHRDLQILGKLVARWNLTAENKILQPRLSQVFTFPINPFAESAGEPLKVRNALARAGAWLKFEKNWVEECHGQAPLELIVLSAILHGGLLHSSSIVRFVRAMFSPDDALGYTKLGVYVDLSLPWRGLPDMELRKWYPDPLTAAMLRPYDTIPHLKKTFGTKWNGQDLDGIRDADINSRVFASIRKQMRRSNIDEKLLPSSLTHLLDVVVVSAHVKLPAVLVGYATRKVVSHSLKPEVLKRIFRQADDGDNSPGERKVSEELELPDLDDNQEELEPAGLISLRNALRIDSEAQTRLEALLKDPTANRKSFWTVLADFASYLRTRRKIQRYGKSSEKTLQPSSVRKYSLVIGRRLGRQLGQENLLTFEPVNLETAYTKVMERLSEEEASIRLQRTVSNALREFQRYLEEERGVAAIGKDVLGFEGGLLPVDANVITLEEFQNARHYIEELKVKKREKNKIAEAEILDAADAMMILGFRCGTRRMEAHGLKIGDLVENGSPWLIIRPSDGRRLKTPNAIRQLPLHALLPKDELQALVHWKESREAQGASRDENLFGGIKVEGQELIPVERLISVIHEALRHVTGDESVHYHHLRHSCATWVFLRLMLSDLTAIPTIFPHLTATTAWLKESRSFRVLLYGRDCSTRQHALAVASLLGHSGYRVSLENYVHSMDWLLTLFLGESALNEIAAYDRRAAAGVKIFKKRFPHLANRFEDQSVQANDEGTWLEKAWSLLRHGKSGGDSGEDTGREISDREQMLGRVEKIANIVNPRGRKTPRHKFEEINDPLTPGRRHLIPPRPDDVSDVQHLIDKLKDVAKADPKRLKRILGYYLNNTWQTGTLLPFRDPDSPQDAVDYVRFLLALDIEYDDIWLGSYHELKRSRWRRLWIEGLEKELHHRFLVHNLKWHFKQSDGESKQSQSTSKMLMIEPLVGKETKRNSSAFRFLMVMAAIYFGYQE